MNQLKQLLLSSCLACLLITCKTNPSQTTSKPDIITTHLDSSINPATDFFRYSCGGWIKKNPIPPEESSWGIGNLVVNENYEKLKKICEAAAQSSDPKQKMIGDFYSTAMDSAKCDKLGISVLQSELNEIDNMMDLRALLDKIAYYQRMGVGVGFDYYIDQDAKNSDRIVLYLSQGGLGLPDRDYYFNEDERSKRICLEYQNYIKTILSLTGKDSSTAAALAEKVFALETILAHNSRKLEALRDPYKNYNAKSVAELQQLTSEFHWAKWFESNKIKVDTVVVGQPEFFSNLNHMYRKTPMDVWKAYLRFHFVSSFANTLNKELADAHFNFYSKTIRGVEQQKPRWKRSLNATESALGELLGQEYSRNYFGPDQKKRYNDMVEAVRESFREHILSLDWMSSETKEKAINKLTKMSKKVGYPDQWKDFSGMKISRNSYFENVKNARLWWFDDQVKKLYKPVDRNEWAMTPQTYNAYYNPSNNEIVLPAAIFSVPGYKDQELDDALIYGYAGASTIGHEITHGFDDQGRQYDEKGNLNNWWKDQDAKLFSEKAKRIIHQFNAYKVLDSLHINGDATKGENIADLGGLVIALDAFKKTEQYKNNVIIEGLNPIQRYFLGYALGWLNHTRDENLADQIMTDVHSPSFLRINGPLSNIPEFYQAFGVKESDIMYRPDSVRVKIW